MGRTLIRETVAAEHGTVIRFHVCPVCGKPHQPPRELVLTCRAIDASLYRKEDQRVNETCAGCWLWAAKVEDPEEYGVTS